MPPGMLIDHDVVARVQAITTHGLAGHFHYEDIRPYVLERNLYGLLTGIQSAGDNVVIASNTLEQL